MSQTKYFVSSASGSYTEWESIISELSIVGQVAVITGNAGNDWVYVGQGAEVDLRQVATGVNRFYLTGKLEDYTQSNVGNTYTLTRSVNGAEEKVTFIVQGGNAYDELYFADGAVNVSSALLYKDFKWNKITKSNLAPALKTPPISEVSNPNAGSEPLLVYINDAAGDHIPGVRPGTDLRVTGNVGADSVYVAAGSKVNAVELSTGRDDIYFTGNLAEYNQDIKGNTYTFTRTVGDKVETVVFQVQAETDRLFFADGSVEINRDSLYKNYEYQEIAYPAENKNPNSTPTSLLEKIGKDANDGDATSKNDPDLTADKLNELYGVDGATEYNVPSYQKYIDEHPEMFSDPATVSEIQKMIDAVNTANTPAAPDLATSSDNGASSTDDITNDTTPTVTGTGGIPGETVTLYDTDGTTVLGTATVASDGTWSIDSSELGDGTHDLQVQYTDSDGNKSSIGQPITVTIETDAPTNGVTINSIDQDSGTAGDFITNDSDGLTINATLDASLATGETVQYSNDNGLTWTSIPAPSITGTAITYTDANLTSSSTIKFRVQDTAGNNGPEASKAIVIDTQGPQLATTAFNVDENSTTVATLQGSDGTGMAATGAYAIAGGADAILFTIDSATGALRFKTAKDYENPDDNGANGTYNLDVTLTDKAGNSSTESLTVTLDNVNEAPVAGGAMASQLAVVGRGFTLDVSGKFSDPDAGDSLTYSAQDLPAGLTIDSAGKISGQATTAANDVEVTVTATDTDGLTASKAFYLTVVEPPIFTAIGLASGSSGVVKGGDSVSFAVTVSEEVWVSNAPTIDLTVNGQSMTATYAGGSGTKTLIFTGTAPASGDGNNVAISSINGLADVVSKANSSVTLKGTTGQSTTTLTVDNTAPKVNVTTFDVDEGSTSVATLAVTEDGGGLPASGGFSISGTDASLFTIDNNTGALSFVAAKDYENPDDTGTDGTYNLNVKIIDKVGNSSTTALTVNLANVNEAPMVVNTINAQTAVAGAAFTLDAGSAFKDPDTSDTLTYTIKDLPSGLSINSSNGEISGQAASGTAGDHTVTVTAKDAGGLSTDTTFTLTVHEAPKGSLSLDGKTNIDVQSNIVLEFTEEVTAVSGKDIRIIDVNKTGWKDDTTDTSQTIDVDDTTQVTISGNKVIINPTYDLDFGSNYRVEVDAGAFTGNTSGQDSIAITTADNLDFTTVTPTQDGAQSQSVKDDGTLVNTYSYVDTAGQGSSSNNPSQVEFDASGADYAFVGSLKGSNNQGYDAHVKVTNFAANTAADALTVGDILYYDNQGNDNAGFGTKPNTVGSDGVDTTFLVPAASGEAGPNKIELVGVNIPSDDAATWDHFTDYTDSAVIIG